MLRPTSGFCILLALPETQFTLPETQFPPLHMEQER